MGNCEMCKFNKNNYCLLHEMSGLTHCEFMVYKRVSTKKTKTADSVSVFKEYVKNKNTT